LPTGAPHLIELAEGSDAGLSLRCLGRSPDARR